jgi:hypothetical protein
MDLYPEAFILYFYHGNVIVHNLMENGFLIDK